MSLSASGTASTSNFLASLPIYRTSLRPARRGLEIGAAHGFFLYGPFLYGPFQSPASENFTEYISLLSTIALITILTAAITNKPS
uniref:PSI subunit V n=1 Tax=Karenia mikimotoi TaxID=225107 RepID=A0A0U1WP71_KARMI|nr:truncated photosystem I reaction centre subunit XI [Karenia mikimotoi]